MHELLLNIPSNGSDPDAPPPEKITVTLPYPDGMSQFAIGYSDRWLYAGGGTLPTGQRSNLFFRVNVDTKAVESLTFPTAAGINRHGFARFKGDIYLFGGIGGVSPNDWNTTVYKFTVATKTWSAVGTIPAGLAEPAELRFFEIGDSLVALNTSGTAAGTAQVWTYKPLSNTWDQPFPVGAAYWLAGTVALNGKLYISGGRYISNGVQYRDDLLSFDPVSRVLTTLKSSPFKYSQGHLTAHNGKLIAIGCNTVEVDYKRVRMVYTVASNEWNVINTPADPPLNDVFSSIDKDDGTLYAMGKFNWMSGTPPVQTYVFPGPT
jgi:N-acetylneuraminic acid mutarotase